MNNVPRGGVATGQPNSGGSQLTRDGWEILHPKLDEITGLPVYEICNENDLRREVFDEAVMLQVAHIKRVASSRTCCFGEDLKVNGLFNSLAGLTLKKIRTWTNQVLSRRCKTEMTELEFDCFVTMIVIARLYDINNEDLESINISAFGEQLNPMRISKARFIEITNSLCTMDPKHSCVTENGYTSHNKWMRQHQCIEDTQWESINAFLTRFGFYVVDDNLLGSQSKDVDNLKKQQDGYHKHCFKCALFNIEFYGQVQDKESVLGPLFDDILQRVQPELSGGLRVSADRGYSEKAIAKLAMRENTESLMIIGEQHLGNHAFWTTSRNAEDKERFDENEELRKEIVEDAQETFTPRNFCPKVKDDFMIDDAPCLGFQQKLARQGPLVSLAVRESKTRDTKVIRFFVTGDQLVKKLQHRYVAVPFLVEPSEEQEILFFPRSSVKTEARKTIEKFFIDSNRHVRFLTCSQYATDWYEARKFVISATLGGNFAIRDATIHKVVCQTQYRKSATSMMDDVKELSNSWFDSDMTQVNVDQENTRELLLQHNHVKGLVRCGMAVSTRNQFIGASCDDIGIFDGKILDKHRTAPIIAGVKYKTILIDTEDDNEMFEHQQALQTAQKLKNKNKFQVCVCGDSTWFEMVPYDYRAQVIQQAAVLDLTQIVIVVADEWKIIYKVLITVSLQVRNAYLSALEGIAKSCCLTFFVEKSKPDYVEDHAWHMARSHVPFNRAFRISLGLHSVDMALNAIANNQLTLYEPIFAFTSAAQSVYSRWKGDVDERSNKLGLFKFKHLKVAFQPRDAIYIICSLVVNCFNIYRVWKTEYKPQTEQEWSFESFRAKMNEQSSLIKFIQVKWLPQMERKIHKDLVAAMNSTPALGNQSVISETGYSQTSAAADTPRTQKRKLLQRTFGARKRGFGTLLMNEGSPVQRLKEFSCHVWEKVIHEGNGKKCVLCKKLRNVKYPNTVKSKCSVCNKWMCRKCFNRYHSMDAEKTNDISTNEEPVLPAEPQSYDEISESDDDDSSRYYSSYRSSYYSGYNSGYYSSD